MRRAANARASRSCLSERLFRSRNLSDRRKLPMRFVMDKYEIRPFVFFFSRARARSSVIKLASKKIDADCSLYMQQLLTNGTETTDQIAPNEWYSSTVCFDATACAQNPTFFFDTDIQLQEILLTVRLARHQSRHVCCQPHIALERDAGTPI